jgi:hypothetical protein
MPPIDETCGCMPPIGATCGCMPLAGATTMLLGAPACDAISKLVNVFSNVSFKVPVHLSKYIRKGIVRYISEQIQ